MIEKNSNSAARHWKYDISIDSAFDTDCFSQILPTGVDCSSFYCPKRQKESSYKSLTTLFPMIFSLHYDLC